MKSRKSGGTGDSHRGEQCRKLVFLTGLTLNSKVDQAAAGNGISERKVLNVGPSGEAAGSKLPEVSERIFPLAQKCIDVF